MTPFERAATMAIVAFQTAVKTGPAVITMTAAAIMKTGEQQIKRKEATATAAATTTVTATKTESAT